MALGAFLLAFGVEFLAWAWIQSQNQLNYGGSEATMIMDVLWVVGLILSPVGAATLAYGVATSSMAGIQRT